jgi:hypothetical protein
MGAVVFLEHLVNHRLRAAMTLIALMGVATGCGSGTTDTSTKPVTSNDAGPNRRIPFKEEYNKMLGKDGKFLMKPGMKQPPRTGQKK